MRVTLAVVAMTMRIHILIIIVIRIKNIILKAKITVKIRNIGNPKIESFGFRNFFNDQRRRR